MPIARARFRPNHSNVDGMGAQMMSKDTQDLADHFAKQAELLAIANAPESDPSEKGSGDGTRYSEHFDIEAKVVIIDGAPRRSASVVNDADYAAQVEFGIGDEQRVQGGHHGRPSRPLGRAGQAVGGDYKGGPP